MKQTNNLDQLKSELLAEFDQLPHGTIWEDPTIYIEFDKAKEFLSSALDRIAEKTAEAIEIDVGRVVDGLATSLGTSECCDAPVRNIGGEFNCCECGERCNVFKNKLIWEINQSLKRDKWLKGEK